MWRLRMLLATINKAAFVINREGNIYIQYRKILKSSKDNSKMELSKRLMKHCSLIHDRVASTFQEQILRLIPLSKLYGYDPPRYPPPLFKQRNLKYAIVFYYEVLCFKTWLAGRAEGRNYQFLITEMNHC